ncbi:hypothetical protein NW895_00305, partial [Streptomyces sp. S.PNR 29]|nr:hypothetical protein [Streptomyces sp. S.PNR 29]
MTHAGPAVPTAVYGPRAAVGTAHALVFAPVTPCWDEGAFFTPVIEVLAGAGLRVTVVDTLALWDEDVHTLTDLVARWRALLPAFGRVDLLCGNALGGAVAQGLLPHLTPDTATLLVSGPARTDPVLAHRLTQIADLAAQGHTEAALALLHRRIQPDSPPPPGTGATKTTAAPAVTAAGCAEVGGGPAGPAAGRVDAGDGPAQGGKVSARAGSGLAGAGDGPAGVGNGPAADSNGLAEVRNGLAAASDGGPGSADGAADASGRLAGSADGSAGVSGRLAGVGGGSAGVGAGPVGARDGL